MEKSMISLCLLGGLAIGNGFAQTPSKPNILLIIADDCSYYDIGCFGAVNNKTPHIDALARQVQSPNQKIPDRKTKCVIKTHINIKQNVIFGAKLKPV